MKLIDFEKLKVGDDVWCNQRGWVRIIDFDVCSSYPILTTKGQSYTIDGKFNINDEFPSLFLEPPEGLDTHHPPCEFEKGDKVMVSDFPEHGWKKRYFNKCTFGSDYKFECFLDGATPWSTDGKVNWWRFCRKPTEEEL